MRTPSAFANPQKYVYLADFYEVRQVWGAYCKGTVDFAWLRRKTEHATYVMSIIHWLEQYRPPR